MKNLKTILILIGILFLNYNNCFAQKNNSIRTNIGIASVSSLADGYYFSFDVGIHIIKSIEIAPTFSFMSVHNEHQYYSWFKNDATSFGAENKNEGINWGGTCGSVNLILFFKPFDLSNNKKLKKHELGLGSGVGMKSINSTTYNLKNDELVYYDTQSNIEIAPYYTKIYYNYHFNNDYFAGFTAGFEHWDDVALLYGLQFGVNF